MNPSARGQHGAVRAPSTPQDGGIQQTAWASFDLERFNGHSELKDSGNTQVPLLERRRTKVPLDEAAHT